jgi:hypothetical protein
VLVVKAAVPQQNFLGILIDDSRSMQIADQNAAPRAAFARQEFAAPDSAVLKALSDRFVLRTFRFSNAASRVGPGAELTFAGGQTRIGASLDGARQELAGLPLAGLVVVSDGADTTDASLSDALLAMKAASVPVFTVGVGKVAGQGHRVDHRLAHRAQGHLADDRRGRHEPDSRVKRCGSTSGGGRIVGSRVKLPVDGSPRQCACTSPRRVQSRVFRFKISAKAGEIVTQTTSGTR